MNIIRDGPVDVPEDETGENWKKIDYWKAISFYPQDNLNYNTVIYHLHPELVHDKSTDHGNKKATFLCHKCVSATNKDSCSTLSIANGVDFGNY